MPAFIHTGTAVKAQSATVVGTGASTILGTGAVVAQAAQVAGDGEIANAGSGVLVAQAATVDGLGGRAPVWTRTPNPQFSEGVNGTYDFKNDVDDDYLPGITWSLSNLGGLDPAITWDPINGVLNYVASVGLSSSSHTVTATDAVGNATSSSFNITIAASRLTTSYSTPEQLSLTYDSTGLDETYAATVRYSIANAGSWTEAHPLYRRRPGYAEDAFVGCIFDLSPGVQYDVEVTFTNGVASEVSADTFTTRSLPAVTSYLPATQPAATNLTDFEAQINAASPGDIIELSDNTYTLTSTIYIEASGTVDNPIYIRGASEAGTIINTGERIAFVFGKDDDDTKGNYIVFENMTIDGEWVDDVLDLSFNTFPIQLGFNSSPQETTVESFTLRNCTMRGFPSAMGCLTAGTNGGSYSNNCLVYNNTLTGVYLWSNTDNFTTDRGWYHDGIRLVGYGNCVWNNTMERYGDSITFAHSRDETYLDLQYNFAYRNLIRNSCDDTWEMDHSVGFTGIYDNYIENSSTGVSMSDNAGTPNYGPNYIFRNTFVNIAVVWLKQNGGFQGTHVYNNTFVRNQHIVGQTGAGSAGFYDSSPQTIERFAYRNNVHVYLGDGGELWNVTWWPGAPWLFDMSHNSFYPDGRSVYFLNESASYSGITAAINGGDTHLPLYPTAASLGNTTDRYNGTVVTDSSPFTNTINFGSTSATEVTGAVTLGIASGSTAKNAGVHIPGITNGYSGNAPDMGAVIAGRSAVNYGNATTDLAERTSALTSAATPLLNQHYFRSGEGSPSIPNNTTPGQTYLISWQFEGIYYDANNRIMHQLDKQHATRTMEHAYYDEVNGQWVKVDATLLDVGAAGHWWASDFDPATGNIYHHKQTESFLHVFNAATLTWGTTATSNLFSIDVNTTGFHPNLFGAGEAGIMMSNQLNLFAWHIDNQQWHNLGSPPSWVAPYQGSCFYVPGLDELICGNIDGVTYAIKAGAGLDVGNLATSGNMEVRNGTGGPAIYPGGNPPKCFGCIHPRQPNVILAMDSQSSTVYHTDDGGATAWTSGTMTHPFYSELDFSMTVGSLPSHGVVAGAEGIDTNNTKFVFWKPPLV